MHQIETDTGTGPVIAGGLLRQPPFLCMNRIALIDSLKRYSSAFDEEANFVGRFLDLLEEQNCYSRDRLAGHMTGSGWIIDHEYKRVLLLHHRKLDKWLQPGGHADGNENIEIVAKNEVEEETGLSSYTIKPGIFDIDIHTIPERKGIPQHLHYDIRFLFIARPDAIISKNSESKSLKWLSFDEALTYSHHNSSIRRMVWKTKKL